MSINAPLCLKYIDEFRRIHNLLRIECDAETCRKAKEHVSYLFNSLREKQPEFIDNALWTYKQKCSEMLVGGQSASSDKIEKVVAQNRIVHVFDALLRYAIQRLEQLEREGKLQTSAVTAKETLNTAPAPVVTSEPRNAIPAWVKDARPSRLDFDAPNENATSAKNESATIAKPVHDFTNNLALAQAEIKRLTAQIQTFDNTVGVWKTKLDNLERHLGIVQTNETNLRSELSKLKAEHNDLAAARDREKYDALASLQKNYTAQQEKFAIAVAEQEEKSKIAHISELEQIQKAHHAEVERLKQESQAKLDKQQAELLSSNGEAPDGTQALAWLRARIEQGLDACPSALLDSIQGTLIVAEKLEHEVSAEDRAWLLSDAPHKGLALLERAVYKAVELAPALTNASLSADALLPRLLAVQLWVHRRLRETGIEMIRPLQGEAFQPDRHRREPDLVTTSNPNMDGRIHSLRQAGFYDAVNAVVVRPARVLVYHMAQTSIQTEDDLLKSLVR